MGKIIFVRNIGKNLKSYVVHYRDGYYVYAARRDKPGRDVWTESMATTFPQSKEDAIKDVKSMNKRLLFALHPVLRDEGTSRSPGYPYKMNPYVKGYAKRKKIREMV